jgi:hypothetical protein
MEKHAVVSAKIPTEVYHELTLRIPEGERSDFIRDAIREKLQSVPRPDRIFELEQRIKSLETSFADMKHALLELEVLTIDRDKVDPYAFGVDDTDRKIVDYLLHYKGATTPELANSLKTNRWHVLSRLRRLQKRSKAQLGKPIIEYSAAERQGKRKAWWLIKEIAHA